MFAKRFVREGSFNAFDVLPVARSCSFSGSVPEIQLKANFAKTSSFNKYDVLSKVNIKDNNAEECFNQQMEKNINILKENIRERYELISLTDKSVEEIVQKVHIQNKLKEAEDSASKIPKLLEYQSHLMSNFCNYYNFLTSAIPIFYQDVYF